MRISVVGAGTMGAGITYVAVAAGMEVRLYDASAPAREEGMARVHADLEGAMARGKLDEEAARAARTRLVSAGSLADAVPGADAVIEAVVEDMAVKRDLFARVEA